MARIPLNPGEVIGMIRGHERFSTMREDTNPDKDGYSG